MFPNRHEQLAKSQGFIDSTKADLEKFEVANQEQQQEFNNRTQAGIALARANQKQERIGILHAAYAELSQGISGLIQNIQSINFLNWQAEQPNLNQLTEDTSSAYSSNNYHTSLQSNQDLTKHDKVMWLVLQGDQILQDKINTIRALQRDKDLLKLEDSSPSAYEHWRRTQECLNLSDADDLSPAHVLEKLRLNVTPYAQWKESVEHENAKKLDRIEKSLQAAQAAYQEELLLAKRSFGNYDLARNRYEQYYISSKHFTLEQVHAYMKTFPSQTDYNVSIHTKLACAHAKVEAGPASEGLVSLITTGYTSDPYWRDRQNFYSQPLAKSIYDADICQSEYFSYMLQDSDTKFDAKVSKSILRAGKTVVGKAKRFAKSPYLLAGLLVFDAADYAVGVTQDYDRSKISTIAARLDRALYVASEIIPRVAGTDTAALKEMYNELNNSLVTVADEVASSPELKALLLSKVNQNNSHMILQLEEIRTYIQSNNNRPKLR